MSRTTASKTLRQGPVSNARLGRMQATMAASSLMASAQSLMASSRHTASACARKAGLDIRRGDEGRRGDEQGGKRGEEDANGWHWEALSYFGCHGASRDGRGSRAKRPLA